MTESIDMLMLCTFAKAWCTNCYRTVATDSPTRRVNEILLYNDYTALFVCLFDFDTNQQLSLPLSVCNSPYSMTVA